MTVGVVAWAVAGFGEGGWPGVGDGVATAPGASGRGAAAGFGFEGLLFFLPGSHPNSLMSKNPFFFLAGFESGAVVAETAPAADDEPGAGAPAAGAAAGEV